MRRACLVALLLTCLAVPCFSLDSPWISDVFFYWYTWEYDAELGAWMGGIYNTPLQGYYDSRTYRDNYASLHTASEWGLTHHFMDYWGPGWQDSEGKAREEVLVRATEALRDEGYDAWMSVYQDGTDFDMGKFSANLDKGRDAEFYLSRWGKSPAYPKVGGKPVSLVYGRNGSPKTTATDEDFRAWLRGRYKSIEALNARWGARFAGFEEIKLSFGAKGRHRAESIKCQFAVWAAEMAKSDKAVADTMGLPGAIFSWDVGYGPFSGFGYSDQARVFCGPHSYGGIFGVPHEADVDRFIQAAVAKRYGTVFFDTFKNFYHDWEIRIPGTCYPPDFCAFDRFWVQSLAHYSEALLHLSWNEWWEGSNLEPCYEYGKTYCEKNLLYSTIMKQCFGSIKDWSAGAKVAVLLNDWHWLAGGRHPEDIHACIQALRQATVPFDLLPDDFVTPQELARFGVVLAPSGGVGFGYNADGEAILPLLLDWARGDSARRLLIDDCPGLTDALGIAKGQPSRPADGAPGEDMSVFVDVGVEGDEKFVVDGLAHRENWGKLPPDKFGATNRDHTVRWTPGAGSSTLLMLPFSPGRDHTLRFAGGAIWPNEVTVLVNGTEVGRLAIKPDQSEYEVAIPAAAVTGLAFAELELRYAQAHVPGERDPEKYPGENRVCNLAIDWLQLSTANLPFSTQQRYKMPEAAVRYSDQAPGSLAGKSVAIPFSPHLPISAEGVKALSEYEIDRAPRDLIPQAWPGVLYVNGLLSDLADPGYLRSLLLDWAGCEQALDATSDDGDVMVTPLSAGDTQVLLAYNYEAPERREFSVSLDDPAELPIVEVGTLSRDGKWEGPTSTTAAEGAQVLRSVADYYGVYQVTRGRVALLVPELALAPGQVQTVQIGVTHRAGDAAEGTLRIVPHLPSLTSDIARFRVEPGQTVQVPLTLTAREDIDWGTKTLVLDVAVDGRHSYFWRQALVRRLPDLQMATGVVDTQDGMARIESRPFPWAEDAVAEGVKLVYQGASAEAGSVPPGAKVAVQVPKCPEPGEAPAYTEAAAGLEYQVGGVKREKPTTIRMVSYPDAYVRAPEAFRPLIVVNPHEEYLENQIVSANIDAEALGGKPAYIREQGGNPVPSQVVGGAVMYWVAMLPPKSATLFYLCAGEAEQPGTDLAITEGEGGVSVANSRFELGWSGRQGGTVTRFVSKATGRDYGLGSFGVGVGTWGEYDPHKPAINAVNFVGQEKKVWQRDMEGAASVKVGLRGPIFATVDVEGQMPDGISFSQRYMIGAYQPDFTVGADVSAPRSREIVALDVRLARNELTKIFPNFVGAGEGFDGSKPNAGWREAPYIPPYATMMTPDAFAESVSVIPWAADQMPNITKFRQGFWAENRPAPGAVNIAQIEYVAENAGNAQAGVRVFLHGGHQIVAKARRRTHVDDAPQVVMPAQFLWNGALPERKASASGRWWNPYWHYAAPVSVSELSEGADPSVTFAPALAGLLAACGKLDPASPRAVVHRPDGFSVLPTYYDPVSGDLTVRLLDSAWGDKPPATREFRLYFDVIETGAKCTPPSPQGPIATRLLNGSFEEGAKYWSFSGPRLHAAGAHDGQRGVEMHWREGMGPALITNTSLRLQPNAQYRVSFWAKSDNPRAAVRTNIYSGAKYDFPQLAVPVNTLGEWQEFSAVLTTGDFPPQVHPGLRLWVLGDEQMVYLDQVSIEQTGGTARRTGGTVVVGNLLQR